MKTNWKKKPCPQAAGLVQPAVLSVSSGSTYTVLTGYPGSASTAPGTSSSLMCLSAGALHGLAAAARSELNDAKVAVSEVHIKCLVHNQASVALLGVWGTARRVRRC